MLSLSNPSVLVTGATGFLGRHLVRSLVKKDYNVSILARPTSDLTPFADLPITVVKGDITQTLTLLEATEGKDIVFHLAGLIAYKKSDRKMMEKVNVQGTRNVMDACITQKTPKVLHLSSVAAIGASFSKKPLNEDSPFLLGPYDLGYFETKRRAEKIATDAYEEHGLPVYIVNPSTIYGAGDATKGSRKTQLKVARGDFPVYPPGGVNVVSVHDVLNVIFKVLEHGKPARRYIAAGENLTIRQLFQLIAQANDKAPPKIPLPKAFIKIMGYLGDGMHAFGKETSFSSETAVTSCLYHWFDNSRIKEELGCKVTPAQTAIEESIQWVKENGLLES